MSSPQFSSNRHNFIRKYLQIETEVIPMRKNKIISNQKRLRICFMQNSQTLFPFIKSFLNHAIPQHIMIPQQLLDHGSLDLTKKRFLDHIERSEVHLQRGLTIHQLHAAV